MTSELREHMTDPDARATVQEWEATTPPIPASEIGALIAYLAGRPPEVNVP